MGVGESWPSGVNGCGGWAAMLLQSVLVLTPSGDAPPAPPGPVAPAAARVWRAFCSECSRADAKAKGDEGFPSNAARRGSPCEAGSCHQTMRHQPGRRNLHATMTWPRKPAENSGGTHIRTCVSNMCLVVAEPGQDDGDRLESGEPHAHYSWWRGGRARASSL